MLRREGVLLSAQVSAGVEHLSLSVSAWEVLCITLKLAKVFPPEQCIALQTSGGELSVLELTRVRFHIEVVLMSSMEPTDYLMPDLTLSDQHPEDAFLEGDPRRESFLDYATLTRLVTLTKDVRAPVKIRRVAWRPRPPKSEAEPT